MENHEKMFSESKFMGMEWKSVVAYIVILLLWLAIGICIGHHSNKSGMRDFGGRTMQGRQFDMNRSKFAPNKMTNSWATTPNPDSATPSAWTPPQASMPTPPTK